ncbi:hypothetical protein OH809_04550 [Streptomyces sp. NBC_00873]|uniref:hypothetical protein n=1 Tax=unclassified Streptomyces TaxID=2593676 RepID=UPI00386E1F04|nr:hypothetical protein OH809_04550 [Streptomyces sp. NBC_00873]WTA47875.1 hypothetical protein OH821_39240 [Streptomyces sp. NBC_00842]
MRAIGVAPVALLGAAALALTAPAATAYAVTSGGAPGATGYTVAPSVIAPGGQVTLAARGCLTTATASSGIFDSVTIPRGGSASATVDWDAKPGASYEVSFICNTSPTSTAEIGLTISAPTPTPGSTAIAPNGVQGDLGGIGRMNAAQLVGGTALAVAATTGAVFVVRRRNERYSH